MLNSLFEKVKKHMTIEHCVVRFLMAWCFISIVKTIYIKGMKLSNITSIQFVGFSNMFMDIFSILAVFLLLYLLFEIIKAVRFEKLLLLIVTFVYALLCVFLYQDMYFSIGMSGLMALSVCYCCKDTDTSKKNLNPVVLRILIAVAGIVFVVFTGGCTIYKYLTYNTPNFDFGIFTQMFHYMKTTFTMRTTCERDQLLSHMSVHISPVYYLILPFYAVFSSPITLALMQAVIIAVGLIPLRKICQAHGLSGFESLAIAITYCLYPVMSGGCFYDLHENAFLPPMLLFLLYYMEKDSWKGMIISMLLVFSIKEDAPVYVAFIALYMIFGLKKWKKGAVVLISSILYFIFATSLLSVIGEGAMFSRFDNLIYGNSGLIGMIRTIIANPGYLFIQIFKKEKLEYILQVLVPLLFMPFCTRKWQRFILVGPFLMFNLMMEYVYSYNIFFQYTFGSATLLLFLTIINIADLSTRIRSRVIIIVPIVSCFLFVSLMWNKTQYISSYNDEYSQKTYQEINKALDMIPENASVTATTFFCPKLSKRDVLYELYYTNEKTEYIALDLRTANTDYNANTYLLNTNYEIVYYAEDKVAVFRDTTYEPK